MYLYIYDNFLGDKKYERLVAGIETRLTDLGIAGRIGRLTPFTSARGLIRDEVKRGAHTVVVVGNDETIAKVIDGIEEVGITLGIIPVGLPLVIGRALGIPEGVDACDALSRRITQKIDLGRVNGHFFLSEVRIPPSGSLMEGEGKYRITSLSADSEILVSNLRGESEAFDGPESSGAGDPKDGFLDAVISPKKGGIFGFLKRQSQMTTIIPLRKLSVIGSEPISVVADGRKITNETISIEVVPECLKVITGRERVFA